MKPLLLTFLALVITIPTIARADASTEIDVPPIRRIVFFQSGVAQIFHEGEVEGDATLKLALPTGEVEDALRSLIVEDEQGTVGGVRYQVAPSPKATAAANFPAMSLAQILQKHRGQEICFESSDQEKVGKIIGVETRARNGGAREVIVIVNQDGMHSFDLDDLEKVNFTDPKLRTEIGDALLGLTEQSARDSKTLNIVLNSDKKRIVRISYLINAPVWLTTYRIDMRDEAASVQAWAHVDNVTLNDWQDVKIELRSGQPRTFHVDLMSPIMLRRKRLGDAVFGIPYSANVYSPFDSLAVKSSEFGKGGGFGGRVRGGVGGGAAGGSFGAQRDFSESDEDQQAATSLDINASFQAKSVTSSSLQSVKFKISKPVSIAAGQSSAIPIFSQTVAGELLSQFDADQSADQAEHALVLTNDTRFPFLPGPISTFVEGDFVGESTIKRVPVSAHATLIYGTDQSVTVARTRSKPKQTVIKAVVDDLSEKVIIKSTVSTAMNFAIDNTSVAMRKVVLRIPFDQNKPELSLQPQPARYDDGKAFYELEVAGKETATLTINWLQDRKVTSPINVTSSYRNKLQRWKRDGVISDKDFEILSSIESLNRDIAEISTKRMKLKGDQMALTASQNRIANLIKAIGVESAAGKAYVTQITELEKELSANDEKINALEADLEKLRNE